MPVAVTRYVAGPKVLHANVKFVVAGGSGATVFGWHGGVAGAGGAYERLS